MTVKCRYMSVGQEGVSRWAALMTMFECDVTHFASSTSHSKCFSC